MASCWLVMLYSQNSGMVVSRVGVFGSHTGGQREIGNEREARVNSNEQAGEEDRTSKRKLWRCNKREPKPTSIIIFVQQIT